MTPCSRALPAPDVAPVYTDNPGCYAFKPWAHRSGGVDIDQTVIAVNIDAISSTTVQIVGVRPNISRKPNPYPTGDKAACDQGDETTKSFLDLDLGTGKYFYYLKPTIVPGQGAIPLR
jgi:hypothetical protein